MIYAPRARLSRGAPARYNAGMAKTLTNLSVGKTYAVTTPNGCTVTDGNGYTVKQIDAGKQGFFTAQTPQVELSDDSAVCTLTFNRAPAEDGGNGGGGASAPTPEPLPASGELKHGHVYLATATAGLDISALTVEEYGTCELWLDYVSGSVTWPAALWWVEGNAPTLEAGKSYAIALRNDGVKLRANIQYEDTTPTQA